MQTGRAPFRAGTAAAAPGERAFGHLIATLADGQEVPVACWVVHGRRPGPVLYVHSTQHGNEISGIEVVRRVAQTLDPGRLRGTLVAVPIANPLAFAWRRHHYLQEAEEAYQAHPEKDLGQAWPGDPRGTMPERLAHALWDGAVRQATHVLDLHTWNRWQAAATTVNAWHAPSLDLALAFGLWVQARWDPAAPGEGGRRYLNRVAADHGKAACTPNFTGQWDIYEPEVRRGVAGLRRVLRHLEMWPAGRAGREPRGRQATKGSGAGPGTAPGPEPVVFAVEDLVDVRVARPGIFLPRVRPEQGVRRGDVLGQLVPLDDFRAEPVLAPLDALVHLVGAIGPGADVALPPMMPVARADGRVARLLPLDRIGVRRPSGAPAGVSG
jgi:predicted deacylase